jgi:hypothetical protein
MTWLAEKTFYDQFLCTSRTDSTVLYCSHCGDNDKNLKFFPLFCCRKQPVNFFRLRQLFHPCVLVVTKIGANQSISVLRIDSFYVIVERMRLPAQWCDCSVGHPSKDVYHVCFSKSLLEEPLLVARLFLQVVSRRTALLVVGEHTGSDFPI